MLLDPGGRYLGCNLEALRLFAVCDVETILAMHPGQDLSPPYQPDGRPSPGAAETHVHEACCQGGTRFSWWHRSLDGVIFPTEVTLSRIEQRDRWSVLAAVRPTYHGKAWGHRASSAVPRLCGFGSSRVEEPTAARPDGCANLVVFVDLAQWASLPLGAIQLDPMGVVRQYFPDTTTACDREPRELIGKDFLNEALGGVYTPLIEHRFREVLAGAEPDRQFFLTILNERHCPLGVKVHLKKALLDDSGWVFLKLAYR